MKKLNFAALLALLAISAHGAEKAPLFTVASDALPAETTKVDQNDRDKVKKIALQEKKAQTKAAAQPLFKVDADNAATEQNFAQAKRSATPPAPKNQPAQEAPAPKEQAAKPNLAAENQLFKIASYYEADELGANDDAVRKIDFSKPQGEQLPSDRLRAQSAINNSAAIRRAAPNSQKRSRKSGYSYVVRGKRYQTLASSEDFVQEGSASWYGPGFHGKKTASGEVYDMHKLTAAHKRLPLGTKLEVTNKRTGKSIVVTVNDRGPFHGNRILDLSHAAASELGVIKSGVADVSIRAVK